MRGLGLNKDKMRIVVCYDISSTPRRNRIIHVLESYGYRIQKSVFEISCTESQFATIQKKCETILYQEKIRYRKKRLLYSYSQADKKVAKEKYAKKDTDSVIFYILSKHESHDLMHRKIFPLGPGYQGVVFEDIMIF